MVERLACLAFESLDRDCRSNGSAAPSEGVDDDVEEDGKSAPEDGRRVELHRAATRDDPPSVEDPVHLERVSCPPCRENSLIVKPGAMDKCVFVAPGLCAMEITRPVSVRRTVRA